MSYLKILGVIIIFFIAFYIVGRMIMRGWLDELDKFLNNKYKNSKKDDKSKEQFSGQNN